MKKPATTKKRNPTDATMRNVRAANRRLHQLEQKMNAVQNLMSTIHELLDKMKVNKRGEKVAIFLLSVGLFSSACSSSPTAPTAAPAIKPAAAVVTTNEPASHPAPTPGLTVEPAGINVDAATATVDADGNLIWIVRGGWWNRETATFRGAYVLGMEPGYAPVEGPQGLRTQNGRLQIAWIEDSNDLIVYYKLNTTDCGRVQVDMSVDDQGRSANPVGAVVNYGKACVPPVVPPVTPEPPVVPDPPVVPPAPPVACVAGSNVTGKILSFGNGSATAQATSSVRTVVSFSSYGLSTPVPSYPQQRLDYRDVTVEPGTTTIQIAMPEAGCFYQLDLACGTSLPLDSVTAERFGKARLLDYTNGGTQLCR